MAQQQKILLESGNNELEILEFKVNNINFGINVAKVAEIIIQQEVSPIPGAASVVRGMISLRDRVITVIDLKRVLFHEDTEIHEKTIFILTNFNSLDIAFIVEEVNMIRRHSWKDITKPDTMVSNIESGALTGIVHAKDKIISILDFEKIVGDIDVSLGLDVQQLEGEKDAKLFKKRGEHRILVAEDSKMLNKLLVETLTNAGYRVISTEDGFEAWTLIQTCETAEELSRKFECLITDIEMPAMDGITLSKQIKDSRVYRGLPIIVFSSLVNEALRRKVQSLDINCMVSKPEIGKLVAAVDNLILYKENEEEAHKGFII